MIAVFPELSDREFSSFGTDDGLFVELFGYNFHDITRSLFYIRAVPAYIAAVLAGVAFWAEGRTGLEAWTYSLAYNGTYMGIECVICIALSAAVGATLVREIRKVH